jgi:hypothetical protein
MNSCAKRVPCSCRNVRGRFFSALIALRVPVGTFVIGAVIRWFKQAFPQEHSRVTPSTRVLLEKRAHWMRQEVMPWDAHDVPGRCSCRNIRRTFNASQGFADSTECSCRNTCSSAPAALDGLPASIACALAAAELRYAEVFLQEHLSSRNVRLDSQPWPMMLRSTLMASNAKLRLKLAIFVALIPPVYSCGSPLCSGAWDRRRILAFESGIGMGARN